MRLIALLAAAAVAHAVPSPPVAVTPDNFPRAESDLNFSVVVKDAGLGKFNHQR
ncbi:MAG: carboxylesterase, partial [Hyphomicrobiales bacterium]|nr:carboxylesterase [Hyphomicrobiales bacterium]